MQQTYLLDFIDSCYYKVVNEQSAIFIECLTVMHKRKREPDNSHNVQPETSKPTAVFQPGEGRAYTLSVAVPGSIIAKYAPIGWSFAGLVNM